MHMKQQAVVAAVVVGLDAKATSGCCSRVGCTKATSGCGRVGYT